MTPLLPSDTEQLTVNTASAAAAVPRHASRPSLGEQSSCPELENYQYMTGMSLSDIPQVTITGMHYMSLSDSDMY